MSGLCSAEKQTQDLMHAKQARYLLSYIPWTLKRFQVLCVCHFSNSYHLLLFKSIIHNWFTLDVQ